MYYFWIFLNSRTFFILLLGPNKDAMKNMLQTFNAGEEEIPPPPQIPAPPVPRIPGGVVDDEIPVIGKSLYLHIEQLQAIIFCVWMQNILSSVLIKSLKLYLIMNNQ